MIAPARVALSKDFLEAYSKLPLAQQKKVREFSEKFQRDPTSSGINFEKIEGARDPKVRSVRIDQTYRAIVIHPPKEDVYLLAWVDHHDDAYAWAQDRVFEVNPSSGALQMYRVPEISMAPSVEPSKDHQSYLLDAVDEEDLLLVGVPRPLLPSVRRLITETDLDELAPHLPEDATQALYMLAAGYSPIDAMEEMASRPEPDEKVDIEDFVSALDRPQSQQTLKVVEDAEDLESVLDAPLEQWRVFLHPSQRRIVRMKANGPVRVLGGAGTGKTVCLMHRAKMLIREVFTGQDDVVLVTTYTRNLAMDLDQQLRKMCGRDADRIEVANLHSWAVGFLRRYGKEYEILHERQRKKIWDEVVSETDRLDLPALFYEKEWDQVAMAQDVVDLDGYFTARRTGRGVRLTRAQRADVWEVFERYKSHMEEAGVTDWQGIIREARLVIEAKGIRLPYSGILVDEVQDFTPQELLLLRTMIPEGPNDLFLVGDAHQRIYGSAYRLSDLGIKVRGRSRRLRLNYRTTEEIGRHALAVLRDVSIDDLDGGKDTTKGYKSLRHGPEPVVEMFPKEAHEAQFVSETLARWLEQGVAAEDICVAARQRSLLTQRYQGLLDRDEVANWLLEKEADDPVAHPGVRLATLHRMKGLEFRKVLLVGIQDGVVPWEPDALLGYDDVQLAEIELQERCLFYVACTRARDELVITGYGRPSSLLVSLK